VFLHHLSIWVFWSIIHNLAKWDFLFLTEKEMILAFDLNSDETDAEMYDKFRDMLKRRMRFLHAHAKAAADAEDNLESSYRSHGNTWKRSNRSRKQWARHNWRTQECEKNYADAIVTETEFAIQRGKLLDAHVAFMIVLSETKGYGGNLAWAKRQLALGRLESLQEAA